MTHAREGGIRHFLRQHYIPIVIRDTPVRRYTNGAARGVADCFRSAKQLLGTFKGSRLKDAAFDGLPGDFIPYNQTRKESKMWRLPGFWRALD